MYRAASFNRGDDIRPSYKAGARWSISQFNLAYFKTLLAGLSVDF